MKSHPFIVCSVLGAMAMGTWLKAADAPASTETKEQRDARMAWWRTAKFGMFIHWGLYAVPAGEWQGTTSGGAGEWLMHNDKIPVADYKTLAAQFNPVKFDAEAWVAVAKAAGMKYIVITAKHHDGFAMFKSEANWFNIVDATPFKRDPLKELAAACQKQGIKLGFYYSQDQDWTAPGGAAFGGHWDKAQDGDFAAYLHAKAIPQLKELLTNYQPSPAVIWFDTPTKDMTPALAAEIVALLKEHPGLIWNNRLGGGDKGDTETPEQHIPPQGYPGRDWETCMTLNNTWGFKKSDQNWKSTETLIRNLVDIASKGGNYLLNVGPDAEGIIPQAEVDRLKALGAWLKTNGESIYGTTGSPFAKALPWGRVTQSGNRLYLHVFDWPKDGKLLLPAKNKPTKVALLAEPGQALAVTTGEDGITIALPAIAPDPIVRVVEVDLDGPVVPLPPAPLSQVADGSIKLYARDADLLTHAVEPVKAQVEVHDYIENIGFWTQPQDYAQWRVLVKKPGDFAVSAEYAAVSASLGGHFVLTANNQTLCGELQSTGNWDKFQTFPVGTLHVERPGVLTLRVCPDEAKSNFINLREITLKPVP
jgi:alpha-L-fucosidase